MEEDVYNFFDSDEDEITGKPRKRRFRCVFNLDGDFKAVWDNISILFVLYISIALPMKFSYFMAQDIFIWDMIDMFVDAFFVIDMIFMFFTPIMVKHEIVKNHFWIALNYLKFWFWLDILSVFPFDFVMSSYSTDYSKAAKLAKMPKLYKMFKIAKLLRTLKIRKKGNSFLGRIISQFSGSDTIFLSILPYYIFGLLFAHISACLWHFLSLNDQDINSWLYSANYEAEPWFDRFCASLYYVYSTISTTGYGDIVPGT